MNARLFQGVGMNNFYNNLIKFVVFLGVTFLIMLIIFPLMYMGSYELINNVDSSIYVRYATNNKYDKNIFFENENGTAILEQLENEIDLSEVKRIQDFARIIVEHQEDVKTAINENEEYQKYLIDNGSSVDELIEWSEKISLLDDNLSMACLYLFFLVISFIMVVLFKFRKTFYIFAGIIYAVAILSAISGGISDYLVANVLSLIAKMSSDVFTYRDMEETKLIFFEAFKESTLTFIIFDTVVQICQNNHKEREEKAVRYLYSSLEIQCSYLNQFCTSSNVYIAKLMVPINVIVKMCNKTIKSNRKKIDRKKVSTNRKIAFQKQNEELEKLKELLFYIYYNYEEHTTNEYILYLRQIQNLMYNCVIV